MHKTIVIAFLTTSSSLFCSMNVSMTLAVGDEKIKSSYSVEESAPFSYRTKNTIADVWRGQLHAVERFNGEEKTHLLSASNSLFDVAQKLKRMTTSASDIVEIIGTVSQEGDQLVVHISKIKRAGKIVARNKQKKAQWGEQVRFYISDAIYIEIIATSQEDDAPVKRGGLQLDDAEFDDEDAFEGSVTKTVSIAMQPEPITCSRCSQTFPATYGTTITIS